MIKTINIFNSIVLILVISLMSCEEDFNPGPSAQDTEYVVEGRIEYLHDEDAIPPYVIISKTYPLFQTEENPLPFEYYIGGAKVYIEHQGESYPLTEICTGSLTEDQKALVNEILGIDVSVGDLDLCFYIDITSKINIEQGDQYDLKILIDDVELTSSTTIPTFVPLDSIIFEENENIENYGYLKIFMTDPVGPNFYRVTQVVSNDGEMVKSNSVTDDILFDGQTFDFPLSKPIEFDEDDDPNTIGLYQIGDTLNMQWALIDGDTHEFWNTLEFAKNNQGPFSSYNRAKSNIKGGIGIWGGYNAKNYELVITK